VFDSTRKADGSVSLAVQAVSRRWIWIGAFLLVAAVALAYGNALTVPFLFDDKDSILSNPSLHDWRAVLFPPGDRGETVGGRPVLNVSLALNYAISGTRVWSYHLFNVLFHAVAGLALFGLVRRTLAGRGAGWGGRDSFFCALAAALLWALHPLLTESVTYVVQRAESLMGMWYLLTLYCFARAADAPDAARGAGGGSGEGGATREFLPARGGVASCGADGNPRAVFWWLAGSAVCCALGMATKQVMVSAPVIVLLYDRAFIAGSFKAAWRARWKFYAVLCATWLALGASVLSSGFRGGTTGYHTLLTWWMYAATQCKAILIYIKLVFWPAPLVFDYGISFVGSPSAVMPQITVVTLLAAAALFAMFRWPRAGIFGAVFFAVLAPSSSFLPIIAQSMAEHRMYLPSAAIVVPVVVLCWWLARGKRLPPAVVAIAVCVVAVVLGTLTRARNTAYRSEVSIWVDAAKKAPSNHRAHYNAGRALIEAKRYDEGVAQCLEAARLFSNYGEAYCYAGWGLSELGRHEEAVACYRKALACLGKEDAEFRDSAYVHMGMALRALGRDAEAREVFGEAVAANPKNAPCLNNLGNYELLAGNYAEAEKYYRQALAAEPGLGSAHDGLADALAAQGRDGEARKHYEEAIRLRPELAQAHYNYARLLLRLGEPEAARAQAREATRIRPDYAEALEFLKKFQ
jgi:tetratricopeptide (TPR) repeat protein